MKRFALIGHPVAGSLSPRLFAAAYGGRYAYDLLDRDSFAAAWQAFLDGYQGINVTAPYKLDAFNAVHWRSESALATGAVNLVVREADGLHGYNTDVDGVVGAVKECGRFPAPLPSFPAPTGNLPASPEALVVGTGGAARAAVAAAKLLGCSVTVAGRNLAKAQALSAAMDCSAVALSAIGTLRPQLLIYTIPGSVSVIPGLTLATPGLSPVIPDLSSVIPGLTGDLLRHAIVLEAEYKTPQLAAMPCRHYIGGRRWLLHQALSGYRLFTGEDPDASAMSNVIQ